MQSRQQIYQVQLMQQAYLSLPHFFSVFVQLSSLKPQIFTYKLQFLQEIRRPNFYFPRDFPCILHKLY